MLRSALALSALSAVLGAACATAPAGTTTEVEAVSFTVTPRVITLTSAEGSAELQLPVVSGGPAGVAARINAALTAEALLGQTIDALKAEYAECSCGTVAASFEVTRRAAPALALVVSVETLAAYASGYVTGYAFDTASGDRLTAQTLFDPARHDALVARLDAALQVALARSRAEADEAGALEIVEELTDRRFEPADLDRFRIGAAGVIFTWSADLPHAAQAFEPADLQLPWVDAAPFLAPRYRALAAP